MRRGVGDGGGSVDVPAVRGIRIHAGLGDGLGLLGGGGAAASEEGSREKQSARGEEGSHRFPVR